MWRSKGNNLSPNSPNHGPTSIVDQGCELEGRITFAGTLVLNGRFKGEIHSSGTLLVGQTGNVQAEMEVDVLIVSGQITGNIIARERVELKGTARIFGDIVTPVLVLEEGVIFDGHCKMKGDEPRLAQTIS
jgi:cytoskeletal protein CcmA (bactofilin family)